MTQYRFVYVGDALPSPVAEEIASLHTVCELVKSEQQWNWHYSYMGLIRANDAVTYVAPRHVWFVEHSSCDPTPTSGALRVVSTLEAEGFLRRLSYIVPAKPS